MKPFMRSDRVSSQIQRIVSEILRKDIGDPRLDKVVITGVEMARDLKTAKIYFSVPSGENTRMLAMEGFQKAGSYIKRMLAGRLELRYMPDIRFYYDESIDYGSHIEKILKTLHAEYGSDHSPTEK
jgi:ribosome-binding factor A